VSVSAEHRRVSPTEVAAERIAVAALAGGTALLALLDLHSPVRTLVTFAFLLVGPGLGLAHVIRISDRSSVLVVAVAISIAIDTLLAEGMAYANAWSPDAALAVLILIALLAWPPTGDRGGRG
jgi:hypothetical protein